MKPSAHAQDHFPGVRKMVSRAGIRDHFVGVNKMVGVCDRRPCYADRVSPRWGLGYLMGSVTQGVALGYRVDAPLARKSSRTKGAKPVSPGQRPGNSPTSQLFSPERAEPNTKAREFEARKLEARIAENVVELLEV